MGAERARWPFPAEVQGILSRLPNGSTKDGALQNSSKPRVSAAHQVNPLNLPGRQHLRRCHDHCAVEYLWLLENPICE